MPFRCSFDIERCYLIDRFVIKQPINLINCDTPYMAQVLNAVLIFKITAVTPRFLIGCLNVPVKRKSFNARSELLIRNNFVAPAIDMYTLGTSLNQEHIIVTFRWLAQEIY